MGEAPKTLVDEGPAEGKTRAGDLTSPYSSSMRSALSSPSYKDSPQVSLLVTAELGFRDRSPSSALEILTLRLQGQVASCKRFLHL